MSNVDFSKITEGIYHVIETEEKILTGLQNDTITLKRNKQNRTIKQILGHLIDSASNNHQRMVRLQYSKDLLFFPDYRQDNDLWIALQDYQNEDWNNLIQLWKFFNLHIILIFCCPTPGPANYAAGYSAMCGTTALPSQSMARPRCRMFSMAKASFAASPSAWPKPTFQ